MDCAVTWIFTFAFLETFFIGFTVYRIVDNLNLAYDILKEDEEYTKSYGEFLDITSPSLYPLLGVIGFNFLLSFYVMARFAKAINGDTETADQRLSLVRAMSVHVLESAIGPTAAGFIFYLRNDKNLHYLENWG
jgi:hypothetical protein